MRRFQFLLALALFISAPLVAQESSVLRVYIMPTVVVSTPIGDSPLPKYLQNEAWMRYGTRNVALVAANTTDAQHATLIANADVLAFPDNFQTSGATLSGSARTAFSNTLENTFGIPGTWIANGNTYLSVAHSIGAMFQFTERWAALAAPADPMTGLTLTTQIGSLANPALFYSAATSLGWNTSGISNTTNMRNALKYMADQWGAAPLYFYNGLTL
jgi:hypothetical protein